MMLHLLKRLFTRRVCLHEWRRIAKGWHAYTTSTEYFVHCNKCGEQEKREERP